MIDSDFQKRVKIRTLQVTDAWALLIFERENREWFERYVDARNSAFYSPKGVSDHIESYLSDFAVGTWHPFVIECPNGRIVGRANLKSIDISKRSAEIGYRIAEKFCGVGLATLAVRHLIEESKSRWKLDHLVGNVKVENLGSAKVLERCGFLLEKKFSQKIKRDNYRRYRKTLFGE